MFFLVTLLAGVSALSASAHNVAVEEPDTILSLDEVSVTAIKQSADMRRLPVASTVVGASEVERLNIVTMKDVSEVAPNFYIPDYGSRMTSSIYVRGIGARIDQPVVGLNVDNVPFMNKDNYDFDLVDIERIEILRGPQSTLYGRNTMGGLINIYTLSPMRYQGLRVMGEYGSYNSVKAAVSYYTKLNSRLGMSWAGYFTHTDGHFTNMNNGKKCDHENQGSLRWKTVWNPMANLSVENTLGVQISRQGGYPYEFVETGEINYNDTCFYKRTGITDGLTARWTLDNVVLSSITSFQYIDDNMTLDQDFLPDSYFTLTQKRKEWALTQDFIGRGAIGDYSWLGGLFAFYKHTDMNAPVTFRETGIKELIVDHRNDANPYYPIQWNEDSFVLGSDFLNSVYGVALYHQSAYVLGAWNVALGMRLDLEHNRLRYNSRCNTSYTIYDITKDEPEVYRVDPVNIDDGGRLSKTFLQFLPKLTLTYNFDAGNIYGSVARGYKAGGFNTQMFSDVLQQRIMGLMGLSEKYDVNEIISYKPETSWNYEIGAHFSSTDRRFTADMALFYIDCRDQQLTVFPDGVTTGRIMTNAGRTRSFGAELSMSFRPADRWLLNASYGYTNAKFSKFNNGIADYSGNYIPYAPHNTVFAGVNYTQPVKSKLLDAIALNVNARGVGEIVWDEANKVRQPFYALLGASVRFEKNDFSLTFWGENITGTQYDTFYFVSIGNTFLQRGKPRHIGATLRFQF